MKKFVAVLLVALMALSLIACGSSKSGKDDNSIIGTWELDDGIDEESKQMVALMKAFGMTMSITFNADGTGTMDSAMGDEKESTPFNYTYENGVLKIEDAETEEGQTIRVEDGKLYLEMDGMGIVFKKK